MGVSELIWYDYEVIAWDVYNAWEVIDVALKHMKESFFNTKIFEWVYRWTNWKYQNRLKCFI